MGAMTMGRTVVMGSRGGLLTAAAAADAASASMEPSGRGVRGKYRGPSEGGEGGVPIRTTRLGKMALRVLVCLGSTA